MSEQSTKKEAYPAIREFNNESTFVAKTGVFKGAENRFEIIWPVPKTDDEAMERYGCKLADLVSKGVQTVSHGPDYAAIFDGKDEYSTGLHAKLQTLADNYKPGQRKPGTGAKTKAEAVDGRRIADVANATGKTVDELMAMLEKIQTKGKK